MISNTSARFQSIRLPKAPWGEALWTSTASAPATCGELAQGYLDGCDFLINSPIAWFSEVSVTLTSSKTITVTAEGVSTKVARATRLVLDFFGACNLGAKVKIHTNIPRGKGLASSTSELTAAIAATASALGQSLPLNETLRYVLEIDGSSDGVFLPGVTMCNHLTGKLYASFGSPPPLAAMVVDTGGFIDTEDFDRGRARAIASANTSKLKAAVRMITSGFAEADSHKIALGATLSAEINELVLPKPMFRELLLGLRSAGCLGINCAHTGTVLGVMFDPTKTSSQTLYKRVAVIAGEGAILGSWPFIGGQVDVSCRKLILPLTIENKG